MNRKVIGCFVLLILFSTSCKKIEAPKDNGLDYFPVKENGFWVYRVDSIVFNSFSNSSDTFTYFVKDQIKEILLDTPERVWLMEHFISLDTSKMWQPNHSMLLTPNPLYIKKKEFNRDYMKLVFPVINKKSWDLNAFNNLGEQICRYRQVDLSGTFGPFQFDKTLEVSMLNDSNFFEQKKWSEFYAKSVGPVYKVYIDTEIQNGRLNGVKLLYTLVDYD